MKLKLLVLYEELAGYFVTCIETLRSSYDVEIHVLRKKVNEEAPFRFGNSEHIQFYDRDNYSFESLLALSMDIDPNIIFCGGLIHNDYLRLVKKYTGSIPTILGFDTKWSASLKQHIACLISPIHIKGRFSHCWVPGKKQYKYARKLGFNGDQIMLGAYSADFDFFDSHYRANMANKQTDFPKCFIYVGRYVHHKGINDLWQAFIELRNEEGNNWELWCFGTGELLNVAPKKERLRHMGFVQPKDLGEYIRQTGVFVLPSHFEPWGVAVHEFAAAGFPLICSDEVGATEAFLQHGKNGYVFKAGDVGELKSAMRTMMSKSSLELAAMGSHSHEMAQAITPEKWAATLMSLV